MSGSKQKQPESESEGSNLKDPRVRELNLSNESRSLRGKFMWYKKLKDPKPQKVIDLKDIIGVAAVEKDEAGTSYAFCVRTSAKAYYFHAMDETELFDWLGALTTKKEQPSARHPRRSVSFDANEDKNTIAIEQVPQAVVADGPVNLLSRHSPRDTVSPRGPPGGSSSAAAQCSPRVSPRDKAANPAVAGVQAAERIPKHGTPPLRKMRAAAEEGQMSPRSMAAAAPATAGLDLTSRSPSRSPRRVPISQHVYDQPAPHPHMDEAQLLQEAEFRLRMEAELRARIEEEVQKRVQEQLATITAQIEQELKQKRRRHRRKHRHKDRDRVKENESAESEQPERHKRKSSKKHLVLSQPPPAEPAPPPPPEPEPPLQQESVRAPPQGVPPLAMAAPRPVGGQGSARGGQGSARGPGSARSVGASTSSARLPTYVDLPTVEPPQAESSSARGHRRASLKSSGASGMKRSTSLNIDEARNSSINPARAGASRGGSMKGGVHFAVGTDMKRSPSEGTLLRIRGDQIPPQRKPAAATPQLQPQHSAQPQPQQQQTAHKKEGFLGKLSQLKISWENLLRL